MPIAAIDLDGEEQKIMIRWYDANGKLGKAKIVKSDFNSFNKLYQSLRNGLNSETSYTLEGTKFNSTNAQFVSGFEEYKKRSPTRTPNSRIDKVPLKHLGNKAVLGKEAMDTYLGRGMGAIKDGYFDNRKVDVEESDKLDLKIEQNQ